MGLFNNDIVTGVVPQFNTSPGVVPMDFYSDLSPLGNLIGTSSTSKAATSKSDNEIKDQLPQQAEDYVSTINNINQIKESKVQEYTNLYKQYASQGLNDTDIWKKITPKIEQDSINLKQMDAQVEKMKQQHRINNVQFQKDWDNKDIKNLQTYVTTPDGIKRVGRDVNGQLTNDENKIIAPLYNNEYLSGAFGIRGGQQYVSPFQYTEGAGVKALRDTFTGLGQNQNSNSSIFGKSGVNQIYFGDPKDPDKGILTTAITNDSNRTQLNSQVRNVLNTLSDDQRTSLDADFWNQWKDPNSIVKMVKLDKSGRRMYDANGQTMYDAKPLRSFDYNTAKNLWTADIVNTAADAHYSPNIDHSTSLSDVQHNILSSGSSTKEKEGGAWYNLAAGLNFGQKLWGEGNNPVTAEGQSMQQIRNKAIQDATIAIKQKQQNGQIKTQEEADTYMNSVINGALHNAGFNKPGITEKMLDAGDFKGIAQNIQVGDSYKNAYVYEDGPQGRRSYLKQVPTNTNVTVTKFDIPITKQQWDNNFCSIVSAKPVDPRILTPQESVGFTPKNDCYAPAGMKYISPDVLKNSFIYTTDMAYQGVNIPETNGHKNEGLLLSHTLAIPSDRLKDIQCTIRKVVNGKAEWVNTNYDDPIVQQMYGIEKMNVDNTHLEEQMDSSHNGQSQYFNSKTRAGTYYLVPIVQSYQNTALDNQHKVLGVGPYGQAENTTQEDIHKYRR